MFTGFRREEGVGETLLYHVVFGQRCSPAVGPNVNVDAFIAQIIHANGRHSLQPEQASDGMAVMTIEDGPRLAVHNERFRVASPPLGHLEEFVPISLLDFLVRFEPIKRNQGHVVLGPLHAVSKHHCPIMLFHT